MMPFTWNLNPGGSSINASHVVWYLFPRMLVVVLDPLEGKQNCCLFCTECEPENKMVTLLPVGTGRGSGLGPSWTLEAGAALQL